MANIRVDINYTIQDGSEIVFRSPVDCTAITGLIVYYQGEDGNTTSKEFALADAHGENVGDIPHLFAENVVVKVILDVTSGMAFVQNADTNAYLEGRFTELEEQIKNQEPGKDGKSAYQYAQDGGYTGTEEEFAEKLAKEPLAGTTADITPHMVYEAMTDARSIYLADMKSGAMFTSFDFLELGSSSIVYSSGVADYNGQPVALCLVGQITTDQWYTTTQFLALQESIPTKTSQLENDSGFITEAPVTSVNGRTGDVQIDLPAEPLIGTTAEITPAQVSEAIAAGKNLIISHDTSYLGTFCFTSFTVGSGIDIVYSTDIVDFNGRPATIGLYGQLSSNQWFDSLLTIDIPTKTSQLENDSGFLTSAPVAKVNGKTGVVFIPHVSSIGVSEMDGQSGIAIEFEESEGSTNVHFVPYPPSKLPNPNALTINGTSYDGSKAVSMTIEGGSGDGIPEYIKTEVDRVAKVVQSRQNANTITFLACSDIHYYSPDNATANTNADKMHEAVVSMGQAMGLIRERCHIDFAVMFGDMAWDNGETKDELLAEMRFVNSCLHKGFAGIPQFRMEGNHDDAYESGVNLSANEVFANIGAWNNGTVYGSRTSGYCYRDFDSVKLRVIALNSSEYSGSAAQYNPEQVTWLANALNLSEKGAGWRSIIVGHHPLDWGRNGGTDPTATINAASGLIASFHGHIHNFLTGTVTNTDLPRIGIPNAGYSRENQYGESYGINWKESTTYSKTPGTAQNTSFCVITIDTDAKKIYADHYGAGYDRVIPYDDVVLTTYTVTNNLTNVTSSSSATSVEEGSAYSATLTANSGYEISSVVVKMGGTDITSSAYGGGKVTIASVTGNIVITAAATKVNTGPSYTNLVPTATTQYNSTDIYNGTGYKNGAYVSSNHAYGTDANTVAVGSLRLGATDVIYIKGAELAEQSHVRLYMVSLAGNATNYCEKPVVSSGVWNNTAGSTIFNIEVLGDCYYKLTPYESRGEDCYYRVSLLGTGENLIITHNEPIE